MPNDHGRHNKPVPASQKDAKEMETISNINQLLRNELEKDNVFQRKVNRETDPYARVWRVLFSASGKGTTVQYFNEDAPHEYKLDLPDNVTKQLVDIVKSHERVPPGEHQYDITIYYDNPMVSVAVLDRKGGTAPQRPKA